MPNTTSSDWSESSPALNEPRRDGATEITSLRAAVRTRLLKEHVEPAAAGVGGEHSAGSAKTYYQTSAPTLRPDGSTALGVDDKGRRWLDSDTNIDYVWNGSSWVELRPLTSTFSKDDSSSVSTATTYPFTQTTLTPGTWFVTLQGYISTPVSPTTNFSIQAVVNGTTIQTACKTNPGGTSIFSMSGLVTVSGTTISVTSVANLSKIITMCGFRVGP